MKFFHLFILLRFTETTDLDLIAKDFGIFKMMTNKKRSIIECSNINFEMLNFESKVSVRKNKDAKKTNPKFKLLKVDI